MISTRHAGQSERRKVALLEQFGGDMRPEGSVSLLLGELAPKAVGQLMDALLKAEWVREKSLIYSRGTTTVH